MQHTKRVLLFFKNVKTGSPQFTVRKLAMSPVLVFFPTLNGSITSKEVGRGEIKLLKSCEMSCLCRKEQKTRIMSLEHRCASAKPTLLAMPLKLSLWFNWICGGLRGTMWLVRRQDSAKKNRIALMRYQDAKKQQTFPT